MEKLIAGDSSTIWEVGFQTSADGIAPVVLAALDPNFTCRLAVGGTIIDRAVTEKNQENNRFRAWLTPAESLTLSGVVTVGIQISNATLNAPLVLEHQVKIQMKRGVVPNS